MRKTLLFLFASIALVAGAQNVENCCMDSAKCMKECRSNGFYEGKKKRPNRLAFMNALSETDRAAVKELMEQYRKERKEIMDKCRAKKPAKGVQPTEEQMDAMVKARYTSRIDVLKLQEKYYDKLRKTLNPKQAAALLDKDAHNAKRPNRFDSARPNKGKGNRNGHHSCRNNVR